MQSKFELCLLHYSTCLAALVPDPVCNLKISVDQDVPSVALSWYPPRNVGAESQHSTSCVSKYHIRFKPKDRQHYDEVTVDSSATNKILSRESGLIPWTTSTFEVRAQCGDDLGEWNAISSYVGKWKVMQIMPTMSYMYIPIACIKHMLQAILYLLSLLLFLQL